MFQEKLELDVNFCLTHGSFARVRLDLFKN